MMRSKRKDEHVYWAKNSDYSTNDFSKIKLKYNNLPEMSFDEIDLKARYFNHDFEYPFYINAMTGGSEMTYEINRKLALIAKRFNLAIACGSQQIALDEPETAYSFKVIRDIYPDGFVIGNLSANNGWENIDRAQKMIKANAMQIHINVAQEIIMEEGDRDFRKWSHNINEVVSKASYPVIVKEVGTGIDRINVDKLINLGVKFIDVSGQGGTNFIAIEDSRYNKRYEYLYEFGISTADSLIENQDNMNKVEIIASGGIRNALDIVKAIALGAKAVGMSGYFLRLTDLSEEEMFEKVEQLIEDIKKIMLLVGAKTIGELQGGLYERQ